MLIRKMQYQDIEQVCKIEKDLFSLPWKPSDFSSVIQNDNNIYLVAEMNKEIIGYCGLWGIIDEGHINNVAISKEYQGRGVGYSMLTELIRLARAKGLRSFTLEVRLSNEAAIKLYKKIGFNNGGIRPNFYSFPKEDALIMWL